MKKFLILFFVVFTFKLSAQAQWVKINSPTTNVLRKIVFTDSLNGWACGLNGTIIHTSDGGENWFVQNTNTTNPIVDIFFLNNQTGWALEWELNNPPFGTYILKTTNGGANWISEFFPIELEFFRTIFFMDENFGLIGERKTFFTTDSGFTWNLSQRDSDQVANFPFYQIKMLNEQSGFACGGVLDNAGIIWKTTDGGRNWKTNAISPDEIFEIFIFDSLNILALSGDPEYRYSVGLIKSYDGGESWNYDELPIYAVCFGIDFRNDLEGWSAAGFKFLFTFDGGNTWNETEVPDSSAVYDIVFVNDIKGYACGQDGSLFKYVPDPNFVDDKTLKSDFTFQLFQNYPNPFNPSTKISWKSSVASRQTIKLFDIWGREVETIVDGYYDAGFHSTLYIVNSALPSGVYFYQLRADSFVQTKKMVLIR
ncbi:YCF48-related protein [Ignavibacterium sp.]|uniref:YCF48-related protein n=1 Tax=Ignavibacterium sp. TaxID=2651167 RepID=UPI00307DD41D